MNKKLMLATHNAGKLREITELAAPGGFTVLSLVDFPELSAVEETGETFAANALLKARAACRATGLLTLGDDSGLEVAALGGLPGVHSARFAGEDQCDRRNNDKLLAALRSVPTAERTARFRCVMAIVTPAGDEYTVEGTVEGLIAERPRGAGGFGYDPLFYLPASGMTMAELPLAEKNRISHRGQALRRALDVLRTISVTV
ncbi:MAG: XTP/dITP diphosphatase [Gracilibacteraceae bacterium]|jgi:XTP/dITP diphosphohydrolase|nr:XTP/dITP diphosphatase [Gracilibacteraceae bacterium]